MQHSQTVNNTVSLAYYISDPILMCKGMQINTLHTMIFSVFTIKYLTVSSFIVKSSKKVKKKLKKKNPFYKFF